MINQDIMQAITDTLVAELGVTHYRPSLLGSVRYWFKFNDLTFSIQANSSGQVYVGTTTFRLHRDFNELFDLADPDMLDKIVAALREHSAHTQVLAEPTPSPNNQQP